MKNASFKIVIFVNEKKIDFAHAKLILLVKAPFLTELFLLLNKYLLGKITKQNHSRPTVTFLFNKIGSF